jgi:hypothetical protein
MRKARKAQPPGRVLARTLAGELRHATVSGGAGADGTASVTIEGGSGKYDITNASWDADAE